MEEWVRAGAPDSYNFKHPFSKTLAKNILNNGWHPIAAEYIVFDLAMRCATCVDMICTDDAGRLIFLELKTGYGGGVFNHEAQFQWARGLPLPCQGRATPRELALVQIAFGLGMARRMLRIPSTVCLAYVLQIDEAKLRFVELETAFLTNQYLALCQRILSRRTHK